MFRVFSQIRHTNSMVSIRLFAAPSAKQVKDLRAMTGSPLKDCLKVLTETDGDIEKSKELLRKAGLAQAEKRADRDATQGLIQLRHDANSNKVSMVHFSCETDFVAKTDRFIDGIKAITDAIHETDSIMVDQKQSSDESLL